jgi:hypothetical protein
LYFSLNNALIASGEYSLEGCVFIKMDNDHGQTRVASGSPFSTDFQQTFGLSGKALGEIGP